MSISAQRNLTYKLGQYSDAVPVLPAEVYPSRTAFFPVPSSTTFCIICFIWAAVMGNHAPSIRRMKGNRLRRG